MKKSFSIYKLHFTTPLHLGDNRDDYSISLKSISSDAMYAALTSCLAKLGKEIPKDGDLGFKISSLFPFYQKDEKSEAVYFLPRPFKRTVFENELELSPKSLKKVQWLDIAFFDKLINNEPIVIENEKYIQGEYLTTKEIDKDFISSQVSPRVQVPRDYNTEKDAMPFYMDRVYFKDYSGLYFIMGGATNLLNPALELLQYEGIGTDRNVGNGQFVFSEDEIEINLPDEDETDYAMSLSIFVPKSKEELQKMLRGDKIGYDFVRRGGWITTPPHNTYRKSAIYAFTHGSVFSMKMELSVETRGRIVDLKPDFIEHSVWRNGKAFFIPIKV